MDQNQTIGPSGQRLGRFQIRLPMNRFLRSGRVGQYADQKDEPASSTHDFLPIPWHGKKGYSLVLLYRPAGVAGCGKK